jgi:hypothetical protein
MRTIEQAIVENSATIPKIRLAFTNTSILYIIFCVLIN